MEKEKITAMLDDLLNALHANSDASDEYYRKETALQRSKEWISKVLIETVEKEGEKKERYIFGDSILTLSYRMHSNKKIYDLYISSSPNDIINFDNDELATMEGEKYSAIKDFHLKNIDYESAKKTRENTTAKFHEQKNFVINNIGTYKPIKYKNVVFRKVVAGYYGEKDLQMMDAVKEKL